MLQYLHIRDLALMDSVRLEFEPGFIAVTGETGAGKSILLGALSLLAGARADKTLIRQGADLCVVEGIIQIPEPTPGLAAALESMGLPPCEDGRLVLSRQLSRSKGGRVHINGQLATLANLEALGTAWIDFHGPGEPQKLFAESWQRALLDLYARHDSAVWDAYRTHWRQWREALQQLVELRDRDQLSDDEQLFLRQQIAEIDEARLSGESVDQLERDFGRIAHLQQWLELAGRLRSGLVGDKGVVDRLRGLLAPARQLSGFDTNLEPLAARVESAIIELTDLGHEFGAAGDAADMDPRQIALIEQAMDRYQSLKRKYGGDINRIMARRQQMADKLALQGDIAGNLLKLQQQADAQRAELQRLGTAITARRRAAAQELASATMAILAELGLAKARLRIAIVDHAEPQEHGCSSCQFEFAPNVGTDFLPLNRIASSGELARVMLALKTVLAAVDATPVLVFDEVDANIGGEIGGCVGRQLARLGASHQVFCITHLPQVAARAASHYQVEKQQSATATTVTIQALHPDSAARTAELARMLGDRNSESAIQHARTLLHGD
jgi:DNA repair protein RecN (Recombination protein N)